MDKLKVFPILKNKRIQLVKMDLKHAQLYSELRSDPNTYQFLNESGPYDIEKAREKIKSSPSAYQEGKSIYWSIQDQEDNFLGFIALHNFTAPKVAMSFGIHTSYRRQGIATSAIQLVLTWEELKEKRVEMSTHLENKASFYLLSKMGLNYLGIKETAFGNRHLFEIQK